MTIRLSLEGPGGVSQGEKKRQSAPDGWNGAHTDLGGRLTQGAPGGFCKVRAKDEEGKDDEINVKSTERSPSWP